MNWRNAMSTSTPLPPTLPLSAEIRAAYEDVYAKNQAAIEGTLDVGLLTALNDSQDAIGGMLSADDQFHIHANSAAFQALLAQIGTTNAGLKDLQAKVDKVAGDIGKFAMVAGAINKVLSMVP
jgi:hypothetical protein